MQVQSLGQEDLLEKGKATHSRALWNYSEKDFAIVYFSYSTLKEILSLKVAKKSFLHAS